MKRGTKVVVTDEYGEWTGYVYSVSKNEIAVSETPRLFEPIVVDRASVREA